MLVQSARAHAMPMGFYMHQFSFQAIVFCMCGDTSSGPSNRVNLNKPEPQIKKNSTGRVTLFLALFVGPMCLLEHEGSGKIEKVFKKVNPRMYSKNL